MHPTFALAQCRLTVLVMDLSNTGHAQDKRGNFDICWRLDKGERHWLALYPGVGSFFKAVSPSLFGRD